MVCNSMSGRHHRQEKHAEAARCAEGRVADFHGLEAVVALGRRGLLLRVEPGSAGQGVSELCQWGDAREDRRRHGAAGPEGHGVVGLAEPLADGCGGGNGEVRRQAEHDLGEESDRSLGVL